MTYNKLFSLDITIAVPGDYTLRAGSIVHADFPQKDAKMEKGDDFDKEYVVSLLPFQDMWQIRSVNFVSKEYLSERLKKPTTRQLDPFLEEICTLDDWLEIKSKIKLAKLETDEDYLQLLDDIILCRER